MASCCGVIKKEAPRSSKSRYPDNIPKGKMGRAATLKKAFLLIGMGKKICCIYMYLALSRIELYIMLLELNQICSTTLTIKLR